MTTRAPALLTSKPSAVRGRSPAWRWALAGLVVAVLFFVYWRESLTAAANSDSAAIAIQAQEVLHGNWLLHGWWLSDVSFYTTEVAQYALLEVFGGLGAWVVHAAAAMTYTLIVVLVALLAAGRSSSGTSGSSASSASSAERWTRALLAGGIVASPQVSGALIFLLGPDHTGTVVPVLATWLLIDRVRPARWVPVAVCVLLTLIMVADSVVLLTGIAPLAGAGIVRAVRRHPARRYELWLAAAAVVAAGLGALIPKLIVRLGGFQVWHFQTHTMPLTQLPRDAWHTVEAVLELFGANVFGSYPVTETLLVATHFAGVLLAIAGLVIAVAKFFRSEGILVPGLAVAIVLELGAFLVSIHSQNLASVREIVAVMPLGGVLAGRLLAGPLRSAVRRAWAVRAVALVPAAAVAAVILAGYLGGMAYGAAQPAVPSSNQALATWLSEHGLTRGLAAYWQADSVTLDTGGRVHVSGVLIGRHGRIGRYLWEVNTSDFDPSLHKATFVVAGGPESVAPIPGLGAAAVRTFGPPAHVYHFQAYTILVWPRNILPAIR